MTILGYQPETEQCAACGREEPEGPTLDLRGGALYCRDCALRSVAQRPMSLDMPSLMAIRHIVSSPRKNVFSFRISDSGLRRLSDAGENYVKEQSRRRGRRERRGAALYHDDRAAGRTGQCGGLRAEE